MLSSAFTDQKKTEKKSDPNISKKIAVAGDFGKTLLDELSTINKYNYDTFKVDLEAENSIAAIDDLLNQYRQTDTSRFIAAGLNINSPEFLKLLNNRVEIAEAEKRRVLENERAAKEALRNKATTDSFGNVIKGVIGVLSWLFF